MLVVVVDESEKRARVRSRRVLSKWLPQVGSAVWIGSLSKEGIEQMRNDLCDKASKSMSVSCFLARSSWRFEVLWVVGKRSNWNETGWFAYSESKTFVPAEKIT